MNESIEYMKKYLFYLSTESKYSHVNVPKTYQKWKANYIEITKHFTNVAS